MVVEVVDAGTGTGGTSTGGDGLIVITYTPVGIADAWNGQDKTAATTLSNSDKTATINAAGAGVRSTTKHLSGTAGKFYAEFKVDVWVSTGLVGVKSSAGVPNLTTGAIYVNASGGITNDATSTGLGVGGALATGTVISVAWDAGAKKLWFRRDDGLWNNNASHDPVTGTGGVDASSFPNTEHHLYFAGSPVNTQVTVRTELAEFTQAVPTGFKSWMGEVANAWSANDKTADIALTNGDKTAATALNVANGVRSTTRRANGTAGKYYAEFKIGQIGIARLGIKSVSSVVTDTTNSVYCKCDTLNIYQSTTFIGDFAGQTILPNDVIAVAWDAGAERIWFRLNSNLWNLDASANPATGVNGLDISAQGAGDYALWFQAAQSNNNVTVRTETAEFTLPTPTGFLSWMGEALVPQDTVALVGKTVASPTLPTFAITEVPAAVILFTPLTVPGPALPTFAITVAYNIALVGKTVPSSTLPVFGIFQIHNLQGFLIQPPALTLPTFVIAQEVRLTFTPLTVGAGGGAPWTPAALAAEDLPLWLDIHNTSKISAGVFLTSIADSGPNNLSVSVNRTNGNIIYDNGNGGVISSASPSAKLVFTPPSIWFDFAFVGAPHPTSYGYRTLLGQDGGTFHHILMSGSHEQVICYYSGEHNFGSQNYTPQVIGQFYSSFKSPSDLSLGMNGAPLQAAATMTGFSPSAPLSLMDYGGGAQGWGTAREFVFLKVNQPQAVRDLVSGYLAWKWDALAPGFSNLVAALPANHPYKAAAPTVGGGGGTLALPTFAITIAQTLALNGTTAAAPSLPTFVITQAAPPTYLYISWIELTLSAPYEITLNGVTVGAPLLPFLTQGVQQHDVDLVSVTVATPALPTFVIDPPAVITFQPLIVGGGAGPWLPTSLGAKLNGWFKPENEAAGAIAATWGDASGAARHATVRAGTPTVVANQINGLKTVRLDGTSAFNLPSAASLTEGAGFYVAKADLYPPLAANAGAVLGGFGTADSDDHWSWTNGWAYDGFGITIREAFDPGGPLDAWHLISLRAKTGDYRAARDATITRINNTVTAGFGSTPRIGQSSLSSIFWLGHLAEVVLTNSFLTDAETASVEGYLAHRFGLASLLPAGHAYKAAAPGGAAAGLALPTFVITVTTAAVIDLVGKTVAAPSIGTLAIAQVQALQFQPLTVGLLTAVPAGAIINVDFIKQAGFVAGTGAVGIETLIGHDPNPGISWATGYFADALTQYGYDYSISAAGGGFTIPALIGALRSAALGGSTIIITFQAKPDAGAGWENEDYKLHIVNTGQAKEIEFSAQSGTLYVWTSTKPIKELFNVWQYSSGPQVNVAGFTLRSSIAIDFAGNNLDSWSYALTDTETPPANPMRTIAIDAWGPIASITVYETLALADLKAKTVPALPPAAGPTFVITQAQALALGGKTTAAPALPALSVSQIHIVAFAGKTPAAPSLPIFAIAAAGEYLIGGKTVAAPSLPVLVATQAHVLGLTGLTSPAPSLPTLAPVIQRNLAFAAPTVAAPAISTLSVSQNHIVVLASTTVAAPTIPALPVSGAGQIAFVGPVTAAPSLPTATITQAHVLGLAGLTSPAPSLPVAALTQAHALGLVGKTVTAPVLPTAAITQAHALTLVAKTVAAPTVSLYAIAGAGEVLLTGKVVSTPTFPTLLTTQAHVLGLAGLTSPAPSLPVLAPVINRNLLFVAPTSAAPALATLAITQSHLLSFSGLTTPAPAISTLSPAAGAAFAGITTAAPAISTLAITQAHALTLAGVAVSAPSLPTLAPVISRAVMFASMAAAAPTLGTLAITQVHAIALSGLTAPAPAVPAYTIQFGTSQGLAFGNVIVGSPILPVLPVSAIQTINLVGKTVAAPVLPTFVAPQVQALTLAGLTVGTPTFPLLFFTQINILGLSGKTVAAPTLPTYTISRFAAEALTLNSITVAAPTLPTPTLTQVQALALGGKTVGQPSIGTFGPTTAQTLTLSGLTVGTPTFPLLIFVQAQVLALSGKTRRLAKPADAPRRHHLPAGARRQDRSASR